MQIGNFHYCKGSDIPEQAPVFPLAGALLLPGGQMPLNIFEPRYLEMFDDALAGSRIIGIVQPQFGADGRPLGEMDNNLSPDLCEVGCLGRITTFAESGDGRYIVTLTGICRFRIAEEMARKKPYRRCKISPFLNDLNADEEDGTVDREGLLASFRAYLDANQLEADWSSIERASNLTLVNSMSMMAPYGPAEKQALLEAPDLRTRAETLVAITEISLARESDDFETVLQ